LQQFLASKAAYKMSITRSASARTLEWEEQAAEIDRKDTEIEKIDPHGKENKLNRLENKLDVDLIKQSSELSELYEYYEVRTSFACS
jgi:hypothetical protein